VSATDVAGGALLVAGSVFVVVGGVGLLRFPDFFTRMHAVSVTETAGAGLILAGLALQAGWTLATFKLALILFFLLVTSPTSAHALARAALARGTRPRLAAGEEDDPSTR